MSDRFLDFRSDTLTMPTPEMRTAMAQAELGDDVFGEDPTVNRLQARIAEILGKEAALYVPSGTMSNLIGVRLNCKPGDEMICESECHIIHYEQAGYAQLCGVAPRCVEGHFGVLQPEQLEGLVRPHNIHMVRTRTVCLENTHNRGGGRIQPYETVKQICRWAHDSGLTTHLDGARLFNAVVATGIEAHRWAKHFDTVSVCFSKGLGAPVGSAITGTRESIDEALRHRKVFGGGMREGGVVAAAALYALENNIPRLADDHACAQLLADGIRELDLLEMNPDQVDTNILFFQVDPSLGTADEFCERLKKRGLLLLPTAVDKVRAVTHLSVNLDDARRAIEIIKNELTGR
jgi:threonine aldolase